MVKIAVIGANGFIGRNVAKYFPNTILITRKTMNIYDNKEVEDFFIRNPVDWIIHCVAVGGSRLENDSKDITYNNLKTYYSFARLKIPMIYFSSGAAIHSPESPYGFSKLIIEEMNHSHVRIIRIFGCYGPYEKQSRFTYSVFNGYVKIEQDRYFDFIHVNDLLRIVESEMKTKNTRFITDAVYKCPKLKLSEFAMKHGAVYDIINNTLGPSYISST